jgi:FMN phosphatase YigB (HAD superfamily)
LVFFDLGWTLEDETPAQVARAARTVAFCAARGIRTTAGEVLDLQAQAGRDGAPSVYPEALLRLGLGPDDHREARAQFPWDPGLCRLVPGAGEALGTLESCRLGIVANQSRPLLPRLQAYGIAGRFEVVVCSCEVGIDKPDPRIFTLAADRAAAAGDPGPHWMVGDRVDNDVVPAKALGWGTVRIVTGDYRLYRSRGPGETPDFEAPSLAEAVAWVRSRVAGSSP